MKSLWCVFVLVLLGFPHPAFSWTHGFSIPTAAVSCNITTGNCTGTGGGSSLFTAATCNGVADDAAAFISFNSWAVNTWQASHTGLIELDIASGKICEFISGNVNSNLIGQGIKSFQIVGYGATLTDSTGAHGFFLGSTLSGVSFNGTASTVRLATVAAGSSSITVLDTAKCSLWNAGDAALIAGVDPQGFGDPPNPQVYEWMTILSTASCAGSGIITLSAPLAKTYKSTWPLYNAGNAGQSDNGGPATLYQLNQNWVGTQAYYGIAIDQAGQTNADGQDITFRDVNIPNGCIIPSQNQTWRVINATMPICNMEFDKIITNIVMANVTIHQIKVQSGAAPYNWTCINCTVTSSIQGTAGVNVFSGGNIADLQLGAIGYGASGSFTATNTAIASLEIGGFSQNNIGTRGAWSSGTLTVPSNMTVSAAANNGSGLIRLTVGSTAGWSTGITGDGPNGPCAGTFPVTVIDGTHVDLQGSTFTATCTGSFGSQPLAWAIPGANVYLNAGNHGSYFFLQVADIAVGANNAAVVTFNQNGSPYAGGFPTLPGANASISPHQAPSWLCTNCTGAINVTDVTGVPLGPFGSQATRVVTAANSGNATAMPAFGPLTELDMTVTAACGGASNIGFGGSTFIQTLGSSSYGGWDPEANALIASATPRKITPTTSSGAQSGDSLVTPGVGTVVLNSQTLPAYSNVGNCGPASTTMTIKTNQGVVYP